MELVVFMSCLLAVVGIVVPAPIEAGLMVTRQAAPVGQGIENVDRRETGRCICRLAQKPNTWALES